MVLEDIFTPVGGSKELISSMINSILDMDGHSLRKLKLPKKWRNGKARNESPVKEVLTRFNEMLVNNRVLNVLYAIMNHGFIGMRIMKKTTHTST